MVSPAWVSLHEEEMEDKRNNEAQKPHTRRNPKRHISLVSLLLWCNMVAINASFGLWACDCGQVVSE